LIDPAYLPLVINQPAQQLNARLQQAGAKMMIFGPESFGLQVADDFDAYPMEYAATRRSVGVLHAPFRGLLELTGEDRQDFLHRLLTQDINKLKGGHGARGFVLNVKGRILADTTVHHGDQSTWLEADVFDIPDLVQLLDDRIFGEDVAIKNLTQDRTCFYLIGPAALALVKQAADTMPDHVEQGIQSTTHHVVSIANSPVTVARFDEGSALLFRAWVRADEAPAVYDKLLNTAGYTPGAEASAEQADQRRQSLRGRPIGWAAYNTLRIEEKRPLFHIDFGPDSIPNETGLMEETVSFTAGCYPGQEVVCRIKDLGHPKRLIKPVVFENKDNAMLPIAGLPLVKEDKVIGGVTSSTRSPLAGQKAIGLATIKWGSHHEGAVLQCVTQEGAYQTTIV